MRLRRSGEPHVFKSSLLAGSIGCNGKNLDSL